MNAELEAAKNQADHWTRKPATGFELETAILAAQKALKPVTASAVNTHHNYRYADSESIILAAREALHTAGLVLRRSTYLFEVDSAGQTWVKSSFVLSHPASQASEEFLFPFPVILELGRDKEKSLDKAISGALTVSLAYFLRDLLLIPREDDPASMNQRGNQGNPNQGRYQQNQNPRGNNQAQPGPAGPAAPEKTGIDQSWFTADLKQQIFDLQKAAGVDAGYMAGKFGASNLWDRRRFDFAVSELGKIVAELKGGAGK